MFRKIISIITLVLVAVVVWGAREQIFEAVNYLGNTNLWFILMLIPEQLFMYYCAGQMFFSYMSSKRDAEKIPQWSLMRVAFELNFVNHAIPSGGVSGLGYITWRLKQFKATAGQVSFMYILRYTITICANQAQTLVAIIFLLLAGGLSKGALWLVWLVGLMCVAIIVVIIVAVVIASSRKRIDWFAKISVQFINWLVAKVTFGKKPRFLTESKVNKYFVDLYEDLITARQNKKMLIRPILWGITYSFLEVSTYWLVAMSMGHPEILPQIMVAEAIGSVIGSVLLTPGGVGGYEGSMVFVMSTLGVEVGLATAVVITTRVVVLVGTIVSGYGFYQHAISKIGKADKAKLMQ
ncbi:MAG: lysylphosphatidylglycerol synthase transmembrane domain-containing protein [Candidatus Saccharibacteria bacterium]|nr:lysylphosphatidylglycerol synthase transmembrane domain-containing protein [Candidatus Saccharibacteria bacterium]